MDLRIVTIAVHACMCECRWYFCECICHCACVRVRAQMCVLQSANNILSNNLGSLSCAQTYSIHWCSRFSYALRSAYCHAISPCNYSHSSCFYAVYLSLLKILSLNFPKDTHIHKPHSAAYIVSMQPICSSIMKCTSKWVQQFQISK